MHLDMTQLKADKVLLLISHTHKHTFIFTE